MTTGIRTTLQVYSGYVINSNMKPMASK